VRFDGCGSVVATSIWSCSGHRGFVFLYFLFPWILQFGDNEASASAATAAPLFVLTEITGSETLDYYLDTYTCTAIEKVVMQMSYHRTQTN